MSVKQAKLVRQTFVTDRSLDFFTERGLSAEIGYEPVYWPAVLLKELLDNALDACESADIVPTIKIVVKENSLTVTDNGPGLPECVIATSLDYTRRISDKINYVSPTRGQLGNALKCIWALPYVVSEDERGVVEVDACGIHHRIEITGSPLDPQRNRTTKKSDVKNGTSIKVHWPGIASLRADFEISDFYNVVAHFALLNQHANFKLAGPKSGYFPASTKDWRKWPTNDPTSAHWYTAERFHNLVMAYRANGREGTSVREFASDFDGLRGSQYQKKVIAQARLTGKVLAELNDAAITRLLIKMKAETRPVQPQQLGVIGEEHFRNTLLALGTSPKSFQYKKKTGIEDGMPFVVEAAFGIKTASDVRDLVVGLNFSPIFGVPSQHFENALDANSVYDDDPVVVAVHLVTPQLRFTTLGKGKIADESVAIRQALSETIKRVTRRYAKKKKQARRRLRQYELDEDNEEKNEIKTAAYKVMPEAYLMASDDGRLPVKPRQIMYAARPLILEITGGKIWGKADYFTQTLLPGYLEEFPEQTAKWRVHYDSRGHFREPHTETKFGIGTAEVRDYIAAWKRGSRETFGPYNRFKNALFTEKEGFDALIEESNTAKRFDIALLSTKGMSNTASRELVEELSNAGVRIFVAHDFDFSGFGIFHTLGHDTRRHEFEISPNVIDIGLRLTDVRKMKLQSEPYDLKQKKDPRIKLREYGATRAELEFLIGEQNDSGDKVYWDATRVELNAMTSPQFIAWLERKLLANGVEKLVPDVELLEPIWQERQKHSALEAFKITDGEQVRAIEAQLRNAMAQLETAFAAQYAAPRTPNDLREQVAQHLRGNPLLPWNTAILEVATAK